MHGLLGLAGLLGLVALAFGQPAAAILARILIFAAIALAALVAVGTSTGLFRGF